MWFTPVATPAEVAETIRERGCAFVVELAPPDLVADIHRELTRILADTPLGRHEYVGLRTRRTGRLFARTRAVDPLVLSPFLLEVVDDVLGHCQLNSPSGIELLPGEVDQFWHYDDMFYPMRRPHPEVVLNTLWAIDEFTADNGATRIAPDSHRWGPDRKPVTGDGDGDGDVTVQAVMPPGSVAFVAGSCWHSAGANRTRRSRIGLSLEFSASWLRPQENMSLSVPPSIARGLPERLQDLLGYHVTSTGLGHVGGEHPRVVFDDEAGTAEGWC